MTKCNKTEEAKCIKQHVRTCTKNDTTQKVDDVDENMPMVIKCIVNGVTDMATASGSIVVL